MLLDSGRLKKHKPMLCMNLDWLLNWAEGTATKGILGTTGEI